MKTLRLLITFVTIAVIGFGCSYSSRQNVNTTNDPLDLWNEGTSKAAILTFIKTVTDANNPEFLPGKDRMAVFDMDGTILLERPNYVLFDFVMRRLMEQIAGNPDLKKKQPYKAVFEQDWAYFEKLPLTGDDGLYSVLLYAFDGYTDVQYRDAVRKYLSTVIDKRYNKPYDQLAFAPMVQLFRYLHANQFEVYIVSGSDPEFTRAFSEASFNIPPQNVLGSTVLTKWVETDSISYFVREHRFVEPINDEAGKPVNILNKVGIVPAIAIGNSAGDYHMLEYSKNARHSLQMIVNHDDSVREYDYQAIKMKMMCKENGWQEISMKNDFKLIFNK
jgi:phosphoglycolate phosphatase-like HAD superfamily hydrolase